MPFISRKIALSICTTLVSLLSLNALADANQLQLVIPKDVTVDVVVPPKYGRSAAEYFYTPIIGINYTDITQFAPNFFVPETQALVSTNNVNANQTSLGGAIGFLVDGQYQVVSTDYWRAGFQTGLFYTSETESTFKAQVCTGTNCNQGGTEFYQKGTFASSSVNAPFFFTFSYYAENDRYIYSLKAGPMISYQMYKVDFAGFDISPTTEFQVGLGLGIDGRFRLGDSNKFVLVGFNTGSPFAGGGGSGFSGVEAVADFTMYVGLSFS